MADEQAKVDTTTENQVDNTDVNVSEDGKNTTDVAGDRRGEPDLSVALKQERAKRQQLETQLNDPEFIYDHGRRIGAFQVVEEESSDVPITPQREVRQPQVNISKVIDERVTSILDYQEALREMPEIAKDPELAAWGSALVDSGKSYTEAVKIIKGRLGKTEQAGVERGVTIRSEATEAKANATTAISTAPTTGGSAEAENIRERMKSRDPREQGKAYEEWQLYKMQNPNYKK